MQMMIWTGEIYSLTEANTMSSLTTLQVDVVMEVGCSSTIG